MFRSTILCCGGTGCHSNNSGKIIEEFKKQLKENNLENEVQVVETGCFGLCAVGPVVIIYPEGAFYSAIKPEDVAEIVSEHIIKGRLVERLLYKEKKTHDAVRALSDTNFYKKQTRVALRNCGVINPENKRVFSFEFIKSFSLNKEDIYGLINVKVYNEMWTCNKDGSNNLKNNNYNYNNENNEESLTIIGEAKIPINLIANTKGDKIFCGNMCIIHRGMGVIGHLYMKIEINEKDFDAAETKGNNILEDIDKEEENIEKIDLNL